MKSMMSVANNSLRRIKNYFFSNTKESLFNNGAHILFGCIFLSFYFDPILMFYIYLKLHSLHYYITFAHIYKYPNLYRWKHLIRLTDTGHYANFLSYYYPPAIPVCHNVQMIICAGYWITYTFFGLRDEDDNNDPNNGVIHGIQNFHTTLNHSVAYLILAHKSFTNDYIFDDTTALLSFGWVYFWLLCIYCPWRYYTGDVVYSIFSHKTPIHTLSLCLLLLHGLLYGANEIGKVINIFSLVNDI